MATSGSKSIAVTSHDTLKFTWSLSSQSVANNTSTVTWKMQLISDGYGKISSTAAKDWAVTVNGTKYSGTNTVGIANSTTKTLASGTTTIAHAGDGTKTFSYSFSQEFAITFSGTYIGTKSSSSTGTLTTIPRKSTLSVANGTLETTQTLTVSRKSTSFTHTITYKCGSVSGTICTKSTSTSIPFKPPISLASQNTTGTSVSVTYTITTYSGSTSIGSNTYTKTCSIPASVKPTVSLAVSDATGYATTYGSYIYGKSKIKGVVTASGSYGSTIKSYKSTANGGTYTSSTFTTGVVASTGTLTINTTVTDSRGRTATLSQPISITAIAYTAPKLTSLTVKRDSSGANLVVTFSSSVTSLNSKNKVTYKLSYKKTTDSSYASNMPITLSDYTNKDAVSGGSYSFAADSASSYDVILTVSDAFGSASLSAVGASIYKLFSMYAGGKGWAFGKVAELSDYLDIGFKTRFRQDAELYSGVMYFGSAKTYYFSANTGNVSCNTLTAAGATALKSTLTVTGITKLATCYFAGGTTYYVNSSGGANLQNVVANGVLQATGATTLKSTLAVTGAVTASSTITATGAIYTKGSYVINAAYNVDTGLSRTWKDGSNHYIIHASSDGLACHFGWNGSSTYQSDTVLRGYEVKLACSGNTGGTNNAYLIKYGLINANTCFYPSTTNATYMGHADYRWKGIYSSANVNVSSDRRLKHDINYDIEDEACDLIYNIKPTSFIYNNDESNTKCYGFIAQDVRDYLLENKLEKFNGISVDGKNGEMNLDLTADENNVIYGIAYEQYIPPVICVVKKQKKEIDILKEENLKLNNTVDKQNEKIISLEERVLKLEALAS